MPNSVLMDRCKTARGPGEIARPRPVKSCIAASGCPHRFSTRDACYTASSHFGLPVMARLPEPKARTKKRLGVCGSGATQDPVSPGAPDITSGGIPQARPARAAGVTGTAKAGAARRARAERVLTGNPLQNCRKLPDRRHDAGGPAAPNRTQTPYSGPRIF